LAPSGAASSKFLRGLALLWNLVSKGHILMRAPSELDVVIFDKTHIEEIYLILPNRKVAFFDPRFEQKLYILPILEGIFRWLWGGCAKSLTHYYFTSFIRSSSPKLIVSGSYFDSHLYSVRSELPLDIQPKLVVFQSSLWDFYSIPPVELSLNRDDLIFCLTDDYADIWTEISGPALTYPSCTLSAQAYKYRTKDSRTNAVTGKEQRLIKAAWISVWRSPATITRFFGEGSESFYELERMCLPFIAAICRDLGISFDVIGARKISDSQEEEEFYSEFLAEFDWSFVKPEESCSPYERVDQYDLLLGAGSTLLYEALFIGKRVLFVDTESIAPLRHPMGFPVPNNVTPLLLDFVNLSSWRNRFKTTLDLDDKEFGLYVQKLLGKKTMRSKMSDIKETIGSALDLA
jgi:hypothetical protein